MTPDGSRGRAAVLVAALAVTLGFASAAFTAIQEVEQAIKLYEAARYEEALEALDALVAPSAPALKDADRETVGEYRALCLLALDRADAAERTVADLFALRPDYRPRSNDMPPPLQKLVAAVRQRLMPSLVRGEYRAGRAAYDKDARDEAARHFRMVATLLGAPDLDPAVRESLADVGELASGFLAIIDAKPAAPPAGDRGALNAGASNTTPAKPNPPPSAASASPTSPGPEFYGPEDTNVAPPVAIRQELPAWRSAVPEPILSPRRGMLEIVIDAKGRVTRAQMIAAIHPLYDRLVVTTAMQWRYRPATKDGNAVPYRKVIQITVTGPPTKGGVQAPGSV
jgi:hypothetical protein